MIRASNQLSPKTKVVALIVLYNFYFGKISCSNVKFGALDGQSRLKVTQSRSTGTPLFCSVHRRPSTLASPRVGCRRTSPTALSCPSLSPLPEPCPFSPPSRSTEPSNPSPAARHRRSCAGRPPPSRRHFLAPRPPSTFLALPSTHAVRSRARSSQSRPESRRGRRPPSPSTPSRRPSRQASLSGLPPSDSAAR